MKNFICCHLLRSETLIYPEIYLSLISTIVIISKNIVLNLDSEIKLIRKTHMNNLLQCINNIQCYHIIIVYQTILLHIYIYIYIYGREKFKRTTCLSLQACFVVAHLSGDISRFSISLLTV